MRLLNVSLSRGAVSGLVLAGIVLLLVLLAPSVPLILFAAVLLAVFLNNCASWIAERTRLPMPLALTLTCVAIAAGFVLLGVVAAPVLADQAAQLWEQLPRAVQGLRTRLEAQSWGPALLERLSPGQLMESGGGAAGGVAGRAGLAVVSTFGALATFAIIVVLGVFLAADPGTYRAGVVALVAPSGRERAEAVLRQLGRTLQGWLLAQISSMAVIGALTALGLWLLGVQLAVVLGVIAALLTFIPNLGPILASVPALLLAFAEGPTEVLWVAALYVGVQVIEGNVTTPLIQQRTISLPPALIIATQLLMASLFGLLGLALATPLAAVSVTLTQLLYVHGYLGREPGRGPPA